MLVIHQNINHKNTLIVFYSYKNTKNKQKLLGDSSRNLNIIINVAKELYDINELIHMFVSCEV